MTGINGLAFQYGGGFGNIMKALDSIQMVDKDKWIIDCLWVEGPTGEAYQEMNNREYSRHELISRFAFVGNDFVNFVRVRGYNYSDDVGQISTFEDFAKSACLLIVLVVDASHYEIYGKSVDTLVLIQSNLASQLAINATLIAAGELTRTSLLV